MRACHIIAAGHQPARPSVVTRRPYGAEGIPVPPGHYPVFCIFLFKYELPKINAWWIYIRIQIGINLHINTTHVPCPWYEYVCGGGRGGERGRGRGGGLSTPMLRTLTKWCKKTPYSNFRRHLIWRMLWLHQYSPPIQLYENRDTRRQPHRRLITF